MSLGTISCCKTETLSFVFVLPCTSCFERLQMWERITLKKVVIGGRASLSGDSEEDQDTL